MLSEFALLYINLSMYIYANQAFYAFLTSSLLLAHVIFVTVGHRASQRSHGSVKTRRLRRQKRKERASRSFFPLGWGGEHNRRLLSCPAVGQSGGDMTRGKML